MTAWPKNIAEAKDFIKNNPQEVIDNVFTDMVSECKGYTGCGPAISRVIKYLSYEAAVCLDNGKINHPYHKYASAEQQADIRLLCPDIDFSKQSDDL